jgi:CRISPR/Cas system CSM-associated protein Csm3 (group 7 of RAMP superfamily)
MMWTITIAVLSPWHAGSGRGDGPLTDALSVRDASGLPFLPGKTLKGLMRDALSTLAALGHCSEASVHEIFGASQDSGIDGMKRFGGREGQIVLSDATLCPIEQLAQLRVWASQHPAEVEALFNQISSTALTEGRSVKEGSLRNIEFIRPITLYATLEGIDEPQANLIKQALPLVRGFGLRRNRGFGACELTMEVKA